MACSKGVGFDVGIEGHEFAEKIDSTTSSMKTMPHLKASRKGMCMALWYSSLSNSVTNRC
jgi:hypothetical protein